MACSRLAVYLSTGLKLVESGKIYCLGLWRTAIGLARVQPYLSRTLRLRELRLRTGRLSPHESPLASPAQKR